MKKEKKQITKKELPSITRFLIYFLTILFLEISFPLLLQHSISTTTVIYVILSDIIISSILSLLLNIVGEKIRFIITIIIFATLAILFSTQFVFYRIFKVFFTFNNLGLSDQLNSFVKDAIRLIFSNSGYIILSFIPLILYCILHRRFTIKKSSLPLKLFYLGITFICIPLITIQIDRSKDQSHGLYDLYYNINNISLNIHKIGVLNSYYLDIKRCIFGFHPKDIKSVSIDLTQEKEPEKKYEDNVLNLSIRDIGDSTISTINDYILSDTPTAQNEYTGIWKGYNVIYITAESFSEIGVSEELTPTLYKLTHSGFQFKNFYTPNILSTIGGEFQSLTGLYPDYSILTKWREGGNYFPFSLATTYENLGYSTYAYHNNWFGFQDRDVYLKSQGFHNYLGCFNGLENRMDCDVWPESDEEMMNVTFEDYMDNENPFFAYYMTVSGHFAYDFDNNYMAYKNMEYVENLDLPEAAKAYVATQIELDRALEKLITELKNRNKLDNTVIVLMADHYPYELDINAINSLSSFYRDDIGVNHNALIMWNSKSEDKEINKVCMSTDVVPTLYNLFGIPYDSRLFTGKDILSTAPGIAIMSDLSWVTDYGKYYAGDSAFYPEKEVNEDYVSTVNQYVNSRLNIARLIIETDYYRFLFSE